MQNLCCLNPLKANLIFLFRLGDFQPGDCGGEGVTSCGDRVIYPDVCLEYSGSSCSGSTSWIWLAFSRASSLSRSANAMRLERDAYRMARDTTPWVMSSASSTQRNSRSSLQDNWEKTGACGFHPPNMSETEGGATEGLTLTANIFMSSSCSSFWDRLCPSSSTW